MNSQFQHRYLLAVHCVHLHIVRMIYESFRDGFHKLPHCASSTACRAQRRNSLEREQEVSAWTSVVRTLQAALGLLRIKLRTVSLGGAPFPSQYCTRS